jgi:hypothetical protein
MSPYFLHFLLMEQERDHEWFSPNNEG